MPLTSCTPPQTSRAQIHTKLRSRRRCCGWRRLPRPHRREVQLLEPECQGGGVHLELPPTASDRIADLWVGHERVDVHPTLLPLLQRAVSRERARPSLERRSRGPRGRRTTFTASCSRRAGASETAPDRLVKRRVSPVREWGGPGPTVGAEGAIVPKLGVVRSCRVCDVVCAFQNAFGRGAARRCEDTQIGLRVYTHTHTRTHIGFRWTAVADIHERCYAAPRLQSSR